MSTAKKKENTWRNVLFLLNTGRSLLPQNLTGSRRNTTAWTRDGGQSEVEVITRAATTGLNGFKRGCERSNDHFVLLVLLAGVLPFPRRWQQIYTTFKQRRIESLKICIQIKSASRRLRPSEAATGELLSSHRRPPAVLRQQPARPYGTAATRDWLQVYCTCHRFLLSPSGRLQGEVEGEATPEPTSHTCRRTHNNLKTWWDLQPQHSCRITCSYFSHVNKPAVNFLNVC